MNLFKLSPSRRDRSYCFVRARNPFCLALIAGDPIGPDMLERGVSSFDVEVQTERGGSKLPDRVANTQSLLLVRNHCALAVAGRCDLGDHELIPARLLDDRGAVYSDDYTLLNPLGRIDCLDLERSELDGNRESPAARIFGDVQLRADQIPPRRDLFRARGVVGYLASDRFVELVEENGFTNFFFEPVRLSEGG